MSTTSPITGLWDRARSLPRVRSARWRRSITYAWVSMLLLVPCFWQPRTGGGDLSAYIYNSWAARQVEDGGLMGSGVFYHRYNVLFDLVLSGLFRVVGAEPAQRIAISIAVLTFVWGAFAFVSMVSGRRPWHLMPCIAMLAYGWVFHMGFFNFYFSLGLCFWGMFLAWKWRPWRIGAAAIVFTAAWMAHALPVIWMLSLLLYVRLAWRRTPRFRARLTLGFVLGLLILHAFVGSTMAARWSVAQVSQATREAGLEQFWVFDGKYYFVLVGLLVAWSLLFLSLLRKSGARRVLAGVPFQLCILSAAGVSILPGTVLIPGFYHALGFLVERMSMGVAVCVCGLLGTARPRMAVRWAILGLAIVFFGFLYFDERSVNGFEDRMENLVAVMYQKEA